MKPRLSESSITTISDRRYAGEPRIPHLAMIGMVQSHTRRGDKIEQERRYYLCSTRLGAEDFARAVRAHWGVENRLHWVLDVIFHDDLARLRSGFGPENMAVIKHMAMNMLRTPRTATASNPAENSPV